MIIKSLYKKLVLLAFIPAAALVAGSNLPQINATSVITGKDHRYMKAYFENQSYLPNPLEDSVGMLLLKYLPKEYKTGCREMISKWGEESKGKSATAVKPIHLVNHSKHNQQVLLVYTCYSTAEGYGNKYYDERLAFLQVDSARSSISVIPNAKECSDCIELSHIGLFQDTLKIDNTPAISIIIGTSNENPCCDGSFRIEEVKVKYFTISPGEIRERLTLLNSRKETFHDDLQGDSTAAQNRIIETTLDNNGNIVTFLLHTEFLVNGSVVKRGISKYSWNRKRRGFDEELN